MTTATLELPELWMELKDRTLLASLMEAQGKSARHIARVAGYKSHTYVQRLLRGQAKNLEPIPAARIAHDLGVPFNLLFVTRVSGNPAQTVRKERAA
jgi:transcriptional regulator with XRE-family HTH domain